MSILLLSIHPRYIQQIASGKKQYEFRKAKCRREIDRIVLYATQPCGCLAGEADVSQILSGSPEQIWEKTQGFSGLSRQEYLGYFQGSSLAVAYQLANFRWYPRQIRLQEIQLTRPPQSFCYLAPWQYQILEQLQA